jgi:glycosyltransferase involved in cell wall biosynthesis
MYTKLTSSTFGVFFDSSKTTSGQRFFSELCKALDKVAVPLNKYPKVILFNISAPWNEILKAKLRGQRIVIRVDGLYFDKLSTEFIACFKWPLRTLFGLGIKYHRLHNPLAHLANMLDQNYSGFFRILLSDHVVYQSKFSYLVHKNYFPRKPYSIIINGSYFKSDKKSTNYETCNNFCLVTIYDEFRNSKQIYEVVKFVHWINKNKPIKVSLCILGYTGKVPDSAPGDMKELIEDSKIITTIPRFKEFHGEISNILYNADCYISFSYRDSCPNAVIECMAHGLPVVGIASGGIPDIVGDAGVLVSINDFSNGLFSAHRFEHDFPPINFDRVYLALQEILQNRNKFRSLVEKRFFEKLDISVIAGKYAHVLEGVASSK